VVLIYIHLARWYGLESIWKPRTPRTPRNKLSVRQKRLERCNRQLIHWFDSKNRLKRKHVKL
jgi:hypothetical protein